MNRFLSLLLTIVLAFGNSFSHTHGHCHSESGTGGAHIHLGFATDTHHPDRCGHSHSHPHPHVKQRDISRHHDGDAQEACESASVDSDDMEAARGGESILKSPFTDGCSCSDQVVSVPSFVAIVDHSAHRLAKLGIDAIFREQLFVPNSRRILSENHTSPRCPRYSTPIFLRHSALLI